MKWVVVENNDREVEKAREWPENDKEGQYNISHAHLFSGLS